MMESVILVVNLTDSDELPECSDISNSSEASDSDDNTSCDSEDHLGSLEVEENRMHLLHQLQKIWKWK